MGEAFDRLLAVRVLARRVAEPLGVLRVPAGPLRLRHGAVRDLADELRPEAELAVVERDEVAVGQHLEQVLDVGSV